METLKELISTKYGDYQGFVSIDRQDMFSDKIKSLNLPKGVIAGVGFEFGEMIGDAPLDTVSCIFLIVPPEYGDTMQRIIDTDGKVNAVKVRKEIPVNELGLYFKRFGCCGISKDLSNKIVEII